MPEQSPVDRTPVPDGDDKHDQPVVFEATDDTVVLNPKAPEVREVVAQGVAQGARIGCGCDPIDEVPSYSFLDRFVELREIAFGFLVELNRPGQDRAPLGRAGCVGRGF